MRRSLVIRAAINLFNLAAVELVTTTLGRGDEALASAISETAYGLKAKPDGPEPPIPDDKPWNRLRICVGDREHLTWAQWMFAALVSCDVQTIGRVEGLVERRCAN